MEENKKINYLIVTNNSLTGDQVIGKTKFPVSAGDVVEVRSQGTECICMVEAALSIDADSDVARFLDALRCAAQTEIKAVWKLISIQ